jgi:hypothetical protein
MGWRVCCISARAFWCDRHGRRLVMAEKDPIGSSDRHIDDTRNINILQTTIFDSSHLHYNRYDCQEQMCSA